MSGPEQTRIAESVVTINGLVVLRRPGYEATHLADVRPEAFILTKWVGPPYWALHWDAVAICGAVLKPDHRGLVAMREGAKVNCRYCKRSLGDMGKRGPKPVRPFLRMFDKFLVGDGCWEWTASLNEHGYGRIGVGSDRWEVAHRVLYEEMVGPIPEGLRLDHLCHNEAFDRGACAGGITCLHRRCVRPDHLQPTTQTLNCSRGGTGAHWAEKRRRKGGIERGTET